MTTQLELRRLDTSHTRPDLLSLPQRMRKAAKERGELSPKEDAPGYPPGGHSPMHCCECGARVLLVHIHPTPLPEHPNQWQATFWCLNAECDEFCNDVLLTVE